MKATRIVAGMGAGALAVALVLASAGRASATLPMQKKAKELGISGVENCQSCHVEKLPKKDAVSHNDRGKWLIAEKDKRKAKEVDVSWLKDYVAPEKK